VTPKKNELGWGLDPGAEFRSPSETKTTSLSVLRSSSVTGSHKKAKQAEKHVPAAEAVKSGGENRRPRG
jgi:hypothetical protein